MEIQFWWYPYWAVVDKVPTFIIAAQGAEKLSHLMIMRNEIFRATVLFALWQNKASNWWWALFNGELTSSHCILQCHCSWSDEWQAAKLESCAAETSSVYRCPSLGISVVCLKHSFASMATVIANTQCPKQRHQISSLSLALLPVPFS